MQSGIVSTLGGLGVFLLGMVIMTDGLKSLTGKALRATLARYIRSPLSGAVTGAISTAIIQSSSATTVTAVGFVGAGVITFSQALGIIFGANIGTTITGWIVAIVGLKLKIGSLALPLVLLGMLMHLFLKRKYSSLGLAVAGFGLIFVGLDLLQTGLSGLENWVTPDQLPGNTFGGKICLVLIGVAITLVTQSSSAGVATALAAVYGGSISFEQAAAMVVGMDVGTTATAALATIGGTTDVKRTGFAHVIYNMLTGIGAFLLITPYTWAITTSAPGWLEQNPKIALVGFHSLFNFLGVLAVLPVTEAFAKLILWLIPERTSVVASRLDRALYETPEIALDAVTLTLQEMGHQLFCQLMTLLEYGPNEEIDEELREINRTLKRVRDYTNGIETRPPDESVFHHKLAVIHAIDHCRRLIDRAQASKTLHRLRQETDLEELTAQLRAAIEWAAEKLSSAGLTSHGEPTVEARASQSLSKQAWQRFESNAESDRQKLIANAASGSLNARETIHQLDAIRWVRRVSYHVWRITYHLTTSDSHTEDFEADLDSIESDA